MGINHIVLNVGRDSGGRKDFVTRNTFRRRLTEFFAADGFAVHDYKDFDLRYRQPGREDTIVVEFSTDSCNVYSMLGKLADWFGQAHIAVIRNRREGFLVNRRGSLAYSMFRPELFFTIERAKAVYGHPSKPAGIAGGSRNLHNLVDSLRDRVNKLEARIKTIETEGRVKEFKSYCLDIETFPLLDVFNFNIQGTNTGRAAAKDPQPAPLPQPEKALHKPLTEAAVTLIREVFGSFCGNTGHRIYSKMGGEGCGSDKKSGHFLDIGSKQGSGRNPGIWTTEAAARS